MLYTVYYDDYHGHRHSEMFGAINDEEAKKKANDVVCGIGYESDTLYCISETPHRKVDW